jgi:hypothetical protein
VTDVRLRALATVFMNNPELQADGAGDLTAEGHLFARYLLGRVDPAPEVSERYAAACATLFADAPTHQERARNLFVRRHPWALPLLDAAAGFIQPHTLLRRKLFLTLAILETAPAHAELFTPEPCARSVLVVRVLFLGVSSLLKAAAGILLYPLAGRTR